MSFSLFASFGFWRLPASAADLKFLHCPLRVRNRNFKSENGTGIRCLPVPLMFPKFVAVGKILPRDAVWYASNLKRTHQTADAIWSAGFPKPAKLQHEVAFAEQHLGEWQGLNRAAFMASRPIEVGSYWFAPIDDPAPGGESFMDLYNRVCGAIERINTEHAGKDVIAVGHGGTIKAAIGLALGNQPEKGLAFTIDNCSVTRLDHLTSDGHQGWRVPMVNQQPWIADASHNAMHQPAGPEIATASKLA